MLINMIKIALCLLLGLIFTSSPASAQQSPRLLRDVVIESGITLEDWVRVTRAKEPTPSLETGKQAAELVQKHGPFRELLDIIYRASLHADLRRESITKENASNQLELLAKARADLGDWPDLLIASAAANAYLGKQNNAIEDMRRWMTVAAPTHPLRTSIAEALLQVSRNPGAVSTWLIETGIGAMPSKLRRPINPRFKKYTKDIEQLKSCLGSPSLFDDLQIVINGNSHFDDSPQTLTDSLFMTELGLLSGSTSGPNSSIERLFFPLGPGWTFFETKNSNSVYEVYEIQCKSTLLPAIKGRSFEISWKSSNSIHIDGSQDGGKTLGRNLVSIEFLSNSITLNEAIAAWPNLKSELPSDFGGKFYLAKIQRSGEFTLAGKTELHRYSREGKGIFLEGPNFYVELAGEKDGMLKPGFTVTLSRPVQ